MVQAVQTLHSTQIVQNLSELLDRNLSVILGFKSRSSEFFASMSTVLPSVIPADAGIQAVL
jgi:hypothetical protein